MVIGVGGVSSGGGVSGGGVSGGGGGGVVALVVSVPYT